VMFAIKLFLGGLLKRLINAATAAFAWATASTARMLAVALCASLLANLWLYRGKQAEHAGWVREIAERIADRKAYEAAQIDAQAAQDKQDAANFASQQAANDEQRKDHAKLEAARGDAVARFIAPRRVRGPEAVDRAAGGPGVAALPDNHGPPVDGQTGGDFVAVKPEDIDAWSQVELQNADRGAYLRGLIAQGLAVPESAVVWPEPDMGK
jgi:hypothetical protein